MDRRDRITKTILSLRGIPIPGPPKAIFPVAKLGSDSSGSYVEGGDARLHRPGSFWEQELEGFLELSDGSRLAPTAGAQIKLTFTDADTGLDCPGEAIFDYSADIDFTSAVPVSAPANWVTFGAYLKGGTGTHSSSATANDGSITLNFFKEVWGGASGNIYTTAKAINVKMELIWDGKTSASASAKMPLECVEIEAAYFPPITSFNTTANTISFTVPWDTFIGPFTRVGDLFLTLGTINQNRSTPTFPIGGGTSSFSLSGTMENPTITFSGSVGSFRARFRFTAEHTPTGQQFALELDFYFGSLVGLPSAGMFQVTPYYVTPTLDAGCNDDNLAFIDADGSGNFTLNGTPVLLDNLVNRTPAGMVANVPTAVTYPLADQAFHEINFTAAGLRGASAVDSLSKGVIIAKHI